MIEFLDTLDAIFVWGSLFLIVTGSFFIGFYYGGKA
jgi:hypothetical protein